MQVTLTLQPEFLDHEQLVLFDFKEFHLERHINVHVLSEKEERMKEMAGTIIAPIKQPEKPLVCAILHFTALISLLFSVQCSWSKIQ